MSKIDFSYASKVEHNIAQRLIIKLIENLTGKRKLMKLYKDYVPRDNDPINFWSDVIDLMEIKIINKSNKPLKIPRSGPLMVIANHPFGIIDGLILCSLISKKRSDFKIMTHETLKFLPQLERFILPVDFSSNKGESLKLNIETARKAKNHLLDHGSLIIFPSGSVSTAENIKSDAKDDEWKNFPAKLIHQTQTNVIPIYFDGKNGLLFHIFASKMKNQTLKYSSYLHETRKKIGKEINIYSGDLISYEEISHIEDRRQLTQYLKTITYSLKNSSEK
jgi:putative hemolysin|tara:strand:+ start:546 stop:1376 length:831 start_codon:yes stop_codon:yes gene_type:complete